MLPEFLKSPQALIGAITAIGSLGTASFGVVDASKAIALGRVNISYAGLKFLRCLIDKLTPATDDRFIPEGSALTNAEIYATVQANWINGSAPGDQKGALKTLLKLRLNPGTAPTFAQLTGVDGNLLTSLAGKLARGAGLSENTASAAASAGTSAAGETNATPVADPDALTAAELDAYGRFDVMLSTSIDRAYNQADQRYRNWAKMLACAVSIVLSIGALAIYWYRTEQHFHVLRSIATGLIVGLLATPLAPIAKDLSTSINAAAKAAKAVKG